MMVQLAVNDDHGALGRLQGMEIDDVIRLDGPQGGDAFRHARIGSGKPGRIYVANRPFRAWLKAEHVSNIFWNAYDMDPAEAARLLEYFRVSARWSFTEGDERLARWWDSNIDMPRGVLALLLRRAAA